jgi:zinc protease
LRVVANNYLIPSNQTVSALLPKGSAPETTSVAEVRQDHPVHKFNLSNGLRLLVKEDHRLPFVNLRVAFLGGLLQETPANSGVTALMTKMLPKGTPGRTAESIASEIESLGGSLEPYAGNHTFGLSAEVLREDFEAGLQLFTDVLLHPSFPADPMERERETQLAGIRGQRDHLLQCAFKAMRRGLFGDAGYGLDALGTETSVRALTDDDLRMYHQATVQPDNGVLAVFGDVHAEAVRGAIETLMRDWQSAGKRQPVPEATAARSKGRTEETRDKEQAVLALGFPGTTFLSDDRPALDLIQEACSDMGSRLFLRIRDELGLAYYVGTTHFPGRVPGYFAFYCGTAPDKVIQVEQELRAQAEALRTDGLTLEELDRAKAKVIGQRKIARQDLGGLAMSLALDELYGLGYTHSETEDARYAAVTLEEIKSVAARYLRPEAAFLAVVSGVQS